MIFRAWAARRITSRPALRMLEAAKRGTCVCTGEQSLPGFRIHEIGTARMAATRPRAVSRLSAPSPNAEIV
ncbi:MAG TPA: hypothetical protein VL285_12390 [Bryobacteraceae bacterium]|nr:hypothetical protein [Bryobacteraceae bacterium]